MLCLKIKPISQRKSLCATFVPTRKDLIASQTKDSALPGGQSANNVRSKITFKIPRNVKRLQKERQAKPTNPKQSRSPKKPKPFVLKVEEDGEEHYYEVVDKICVLNQNCAHKRAFANLLLSKNRLPVHFQIDSGSTCSILPVGVYKDVSGDHTLKDLNTTVRPVLSLYDEETKIQTLGTRKVFVLNPATNEEVIIQFRIVKKDLTPLIGLNDSEALRLIEVLGDNIALVEPP